MTSPLARAHATRLRIHPALHAAFCDCGREPTACTWCDREGGLTEVGGDHLCEDCVATAPTERMAAE